MRTVVVTESESDKVLLQAILGPTLDRVDNVVAAGGWSSADSLARSVLIRGNDRVALVVDADSTDPAAIVERRAFHEASISQVNPLAERCIIVIAPTIEALLFVDRTIVESLLDRKITPKEWKSGCASPKDWLKKMSGVPILQLFQRLSHIDLTPIRNRADMTDLVEFVVRGQAKAAA